MNGDELASAVRLATAVAPKVEMSPGAMRTEEYLATALLAMATERDALATAMRRMVTLATDALEDVP